MAEPLLRVDNLVRRFGGITATDNLSLEVADGELHAIIGPNGAGKTTLITQLTGQLQPNSGSIHFGGRNITGLPAYRRSRLGLARSFQITSLLPDFTASANVVSRGEIRQQRGDLERTRQPEPAAAAGRQAPRRCGRRSECCRNSAVTARSVA